ncbi:hypothetical protein [Tabrizicola sp.]|jgi:hypothetical protein|uniref:hypothetical protein n=1 Tax=Tabrizicola sp. TaxID=2005166 RepID=UPI0035B4B4DA
MLKPLALLLLTATAAIAQDAPVLAEYATDSGSLPPEYAWETSVTILADGRLTLKHCKGYETEGPACKTRRAKVSDEALAAILAAARDSDLAAHPAQQAEYPMVGGGSVSGAVYLDGAKITLLSQPAEADAARVGKVLQAIAAAIPPRFDRFTHPD